MLKSHPIEASLDFGPATVHVFAGTAKQLSKLDSAHIVTPLTEREKALIREFYPTGDDYVVRLRCEFKDSATAVDRKQIADTLIRCVGAHIPPMSMSFPATYEGKTGKEGGFFDINSTTLLNKEAANALVQQALEGALEAREQWWQSPMGQPFADRDAVAVSGLLAKITPQLTPLQRARAEGVIMSDLPNARSRLKGVTAPDRKAAGLVFHLGNENTAASLGSVGVNRQLANEIVQKLGEAIYPPLP